MSNTTTTPIQVLQDYFGYDKFRPKQEEIIDTVLAGNDALILMPTGGGKSVCYQVPAMVKEGVCIVVSPLISLMRDQVEGLKQNGIPAAFINSSQSHAEQQQIKRDCLHGAVKLLYVSPETAVSPWFIELTRSFQLSLIAVDEAHCISFWGHDFRPVYQDLSKLRELSPEVPMIALTATADKITRADILKQLKLKSPEVFISSFDRPNLSLEVRPARDRVKQIIDYIKERKGECGIVYCLSRKSTEDMATKLKRQGIKAAHYHAKLPSRERDRVQDEFLMDKIEVVCATIAFGMGIDKSNVRYVIHYNLPKNIESYYQEIGRAGRDGLPSETLLFYTYGDVNLHRKIIEEEDSVVKDLKIAKLDRLKQFAEAHRCRRQVLLNYFDEILNENCDNCDVCHNPREQFDGTVIAQKALSAVARTGGRLPTGTIIDVLRGQMSERVKREELFRVKTFGVGRDLKWQDWTSYLAQLVDSGLLDVAYNERNALKLTERSKAILFSQEKAMLVRPADLKAKAATKPTVKTEEEIQNYDVALFEKLRALRKALAEQQGVPPYVIFADRSLRYMAFMQPISEQELIEVPGVGSRKLAFYGDDFLDLISTYTGKDRIKVEHPIRPRSSRSKSSSSTKKSSEPKKPTTEITYELYLSGLDVKAIAAKRELKPTTIYNHLADLYAQGKINDVSDYINEDDVALLATVVNDVDRGENGKSIKPLHDALDGKLTYYKIRFALAVLEKKGLL